MERTVENVKQLLLAKRPVRAIAAEFQVSTTAMRTWMRRRGLSSQLRKRNWTDEQLAGAVKSSSTMMDVMRKLGLKPYAGNNKQLKQRCALLNIDLSHFTGMGHGRTVPRTKRATEHILIENSPATQRSVKLRVLRERLLPYKCAICSAEPMWMGASLTLVLDHISGDNSDCRLQNLRFLCPNCNSQQPTFCRGLRVTSIDSACQRVSCISP